MLELNIDEWFKERKLTTCPPYFVRATAPLSENAKDWIRERLVGRYAFVPISNEKSRYSWNQIYTVAFENPNEATMYELIWS
jgi:thiamine phosphate synthase YjbQ (UPF0047 family)